MDFPDWRKNDNTFMAEKLPLKGESWDNNKLLNRYRDYMMTRYLKYLTEKMYPTKKIIVWAENSHVSKTSYRMPSDTSYSQSVYTIGLYSYSGKGASWPEFAGKDNKDKAININPKKMF